MVSCANLLLPRRGLVSTHMPCYVSVLLTTSVYESPKVTKFLICPRRGPVAADEKVADVRVRKARTREERILDL